MPALSVWPLTAKLGVRVEGLDLSRDASDASDAALHRISDLLFAHKVVVLPAQRLDDAAYLRFGCNWGQPIEFFKDDHRDVAHPELIRVSNATSVPMAHRDGAVQWHNDSSYDEVPATVTMLYCLEAPNSGGATLFADIVAAYEALTNSTRQKIDRLVAWHTMLGAPAIEGEMIEKMAPPPWGKYPHPLVMDHPVVPGRRALYLSATAQSIDGTAYEEGREMIRALRRHIARPAFRSSYTLRAGDLMLWDNFSVAHSATPIEYSDEPGKRRSLKRISTKGLPRFYPIERQ